MKSIKVIYWSGTGNTEEMAQEVARGIEAANGQAKLLEVAEVTPDSVKEDTVFALGCPAMGAEELEGDEMEPFVQALEADLSGKRVGLFGSYGWGDGTWMKNWEERMKHAGAVLVCDGVMAMEAPDAEAKEACIKLGKKLME